MTEPKMLQRWLRLAKELLSLPTAPLGEHAVADWLRAFAAQRGMDLRPDRWGNLLLHYRKGPALARPLAFCAHMDHPGFLAERMTRDGRLLASWRGGVPPALFAGAPVRFFSDGKWVRGVVVSSTSRQDTGLPRPTRIDIVRPVAPGSVGMWDFPPPRVRGRRLYARGHDDVAGVAAIAGALDEAHRRGLRGEFYTLFTRAEESGFLGAIGACRSHTLPHRCIVIALETSRCLPNAQLGDGVVVRVGDKATVFAPGVTAMLCAAAEKVARRDPSFRFQRRLMDGGVCESSVYASYGYDAGGLCLPLDNYHNVDWDRMKLGPECVDIHDYAALVRLLLHLASASSRLRAPDLGPRWAGLFRRYGGRL